MLGAQRWRLRDEARAPALRRSDDPAGLISVAAAVAVRMLDQVKVPFLAAAVLGVHPAARLLYAALLMGADAHGPGPGWLEVVLS